MYSRFFVCVVATLVFIPTTAIAQSANSKAKQLDTNHIELMFPAEDGIIQWADVALSLAGALKLDSRSVQKLLPSGQIDLRSDAVLLVLVGMNLVAGDRISFELIPHAQGRSALRVRCDRRMFEAENPKPHAPSATIQLDKAWQRQTGQQRQSVRGRETKPLLIFIHGLQSRGTVFDEFRDDLRQAGYGTAAVTYDFEQGIEDSANQVSSVVEKSLVGSGRDLQFVLIGHSMGGLVAREWTENESLYDKRITGLITIGTPHHGSKWASLPPSLNLFTAGDFDVRDMRGLVLHRPSSQGLRDLVPESEFLRRLNSRSRRRNVSYTNIIGTGSPVQEDVVIALQDRLRRLDQKSAVVRLIRPRIAPLLENFDELARGKGDGMVSVEGAKMEGVEAIKIDVSHFLMVRSMGTDVRNPVWDAVRQRLENPKRLR